MPGRLDGRLDGRGADSIDDMDLLRHGAMGKVFGRIRAPSTPGSFLRSFTWGNVSQLQKTHREVLASLAREAPLLSGAGTPAFIDLDSRQKRVYGYQKEGAAFGHTKIQGKSVLVKGLNVLGAVISTPLSAPVVAAVRQRQLFPRRGQSGQRGSGLAFIGSRTISDSSMRTSCKHHRQGLAG